ncbi:MAG: hypothetical protein ACKOPE_06935 [Novosphingobium sp.]
MRLEHHAHAKADWHDLDQLVAEAYDLLSPEPEVPPETGDVPGSPPELSDEAAIRSAIIAALTRSSDPRSLLEDLLGAMPPPVEESVAASPPEGEARTEAEGEGETGEADDV